VIDEQMTLQEYAARVVNMAATAWQHDRGAFDPARYVQDALGALPAEQRYACAVLMTVLGIRGFANAMSLLGERGNAELDDLIRWQAELENDNEKGDSHDG
jgi:hypothetical protein